MLLAVISWIAVAVIVVAGPDGHDLLGHLKGADFIQFYTFGRTVLSGRLSDLYDAQALHELQLQWVPASATDFFIPVYPPQTFLLFAPFAWFSYLIAALLWAAVGVSVYAAAVVAAWRPYRAALSDVRFVVAAAAGFPPFWTMILYGQATTVVLAAFCLGWLALEHRRRFLAGFALGLMAIKPQFGLALAVVVLVCREWSMLAGAIASVAAQGAAVWAVMGTGVVSAYVRSLGQLPQTEFLLEPKPYLMHSIRAVAKLIPWVGTPVWLLLSGAVVWQAVRVWRTAEPAGVRLGVVIIASVLVNPHLFIYDATVLILPLIWLGGWMETGRRADLAAAFWPGVYWLFVTFFLPTAYFIRIQASVFVLGWIFLKVTRGIASALRASSEPGGSGSSPRQQGSELLAYPVDPW